MRMTEGHATLALLREPRSPSLHSFQCGGHGAPVTRQRLDATDPRGDRRESCFRSGRKRARSSCASRRSRLRSSIWMPGNTTMSAAENALADQPGRGRQAVLDVGRFLEHEAHHALDLLHASLDALEQDRLDDAHDVFFGIRLVLADHALDRAGLFGAVAEQRR